MKEKPEKTYKTKKPKIRQLDTFVLQISDILGLQDDKYIRTKQGYALLLKIMGIDILGYQEDDRNMAMQNFSRAIQLCKLPQKYLLLDVRPDLSEQKEHVTRQLHTAEHPHRRMILERQLGFLETIETQTSDRIAFLMIFSGSQLLLDENASRFMTAMADTGVTVCEGVELTSVLRNLYQFDWRAKINDDDNDTDQAETI